MTASTHAMDGRGRLAKQFWQEVLCPRRGVVAVQSV